MHVLDDLEQSLFLEAELVAVLEQIQLKADNAKEKAHHDVAMKWRVAKAQSVKCHQGCQVELEESALSVEVRTSGWYQNLGLTGGCSH